jgi:dTDP-4-dehydrorhamnose reductase
MRVLVFGQSGQVATALATHHKPGELEVVTLGRPDFDITQPETIENVVARFKPDFLVNAAAYTAVDKAETEQDQAFAVNRDGAANIARLATKADLPYLHISTDYVFSGDKNQTYQEEDATGPKGVYGASKLAGEEKVLAIHPQSVILRTAWVYSPYGNNFLKTMLRLAGSRDEIGVVADQFGNPTDAHDIAAAILTVGKKLVSSKSFDAYGVYHFCGPTRMHWADFARRIFSASHAIDGPEAKVKTITTADYPTPASRPKNSSLDTSKFFRTFDYHQRSLDQSVSNTLKALIEQGDLVTQ